MGTQGVKAGWGRNRQMNALHGQKFSSYTPGHLHSIRALTVMKIFKLATVGTYFCMYLA